MIAAVLMIPLSGIAQISHGGEPYEWKAKEQSLSSLDAVLLEKPNIEALREEDKVLDQHKDIPYRFGANISTDLGTNNAGTWTELENGDRIWRLRFSSPGALTLNFRFDKYDVPEGGKVFIYDADRTMYEGAFTNENGDESLGVGLLPTDDMVIEYHEPASHTGEGELHIDRITHGYREVVFNSPAKGPFGDSGPCNINVNCQEGADWQHHKKSVALIVVGGSSLCTGALVNNTAMDGTPYFLTADHCLGGGVSDWVFYFNHESSSCEGSDGPTSDSVEGAQIRANFDGSDFALLELDETPPSSYDVVYAGWDRTDNEDAVTSAVGIHHPSGDVMKICFENDAPYHSEAGGADVWYIDQWEDGVTEGGSSGSPLFNQDQRIIGQLYGGIAACSGDVNNGEPDWYGRFGVSWHGGGTESTRLKDWLDPQGNNPQVLDAYPPLVQPQYDLSLFEVSGIEGNVVCEDVINPVVTIKNNGTEEIFSFALTVAINGTEVYNEAEAEIIAQGGEVDIAIPTIEVDEGIQELLVSVSQPNSQEDEVSENNDALREFAVFTDSEEVTLNLTTDNYGSETSWEMRWNDLVLYSGSGYPDDNSTTYEIPMCLASDGCFDFEIEDSWGDGICCEYGDGSYEVVNSEGMLIYESDGQYGNGETVEICPAETIGQEELQAFSDVKVFPNPVKDNLTISLGSKQREKTTIRVYSPVGKLLRSTGVGSQTGTLNVDMTEFKAGMYLVSIEIDGVQKAYRIVKM